MGEVQQPVPPAQPVPPVENPDEVETEEEDQERYDGGDIPAAPETDDDEVDGA